MVWMGRVPFFHRMLARGYACGRQSRVTVVPALAFSSARSRFPVKSGGEAVDRERPQTDSRQQSPQRPPLLKL